MPAVLTEVNLHANNFLFFRFACTESTDKVSYKACKQFVGIIPCNSFFCAANHLAKWDKVPLRCLLFGLGTFPGKEELI